MSIELPARPRGNDRDRLRGLPAHQGRKRFIEITLFWINALFMALVVRLPWANLISSDYVEYVGVWFEFIANNGYLTALKYGFAEILTYDGVEYHVPYLYLLSLAAMSFPSVEGHLVIKAISVVFDLLLAFFVYKCVRLKYSQSNTVPYIAALVALFAPTVILNGAAWGQNDSIYTAFLVACLWALLSGHHGWAFIAFGLSFSFKTQAIFLAPLFLWLLMKKKVNWRLFFLSPLVYFITIIPAWVIGRPLDDLLYIFVNQINQTGRLTEQAPNLYQWVPDRYYGYYPIGILLTALVVLLIAVLVYKSRVDITKDLLVYLANFSVLIVPFLLPKMHERYFFPADIFAIIFAFYFSKYWYTPMIIGLASSLAYLNFLYGVTPIPLTWLAFALLLLIIVLGWNLLKALGYLPPSRVSRPRRSARTGRRPPR